jgi:hypothetical protein
MQTARPLIVVLIAGKTAAVTAVAMEDHQVPSLH